MDVCDTLLVVVVAADFPAPSTIFIGSILYKYCNTNGQEESLYNEANCIFKHNLRQRCATINYGYIDVQKRCLVFDGAPQEWHYDWYAGVDHRHGLLSLSRYLELLINAQGATLCDSEEEADVILVMTRATNEKEVSLIDENFFME